MKRVTDNSEQDTEVKVDGVTIPKASVNERVHSKNSIPLVNDHQEHHVTVYF
jgi:hypothetical protein